MTERLSAEVNLNELLVLFLLKQEHEDTSTASLLNLEQTENILEVQKQSMLIVSTIHVSYAECL